jgi:hypothetical protein
MNYAILAKENIISSKKDKDLIPTNEFLCTDDIKQERFGYFHEQAFEADATVNKRGKRYLNLSLYEERIPALLNCDETRAKTKGTREAIIDYLNRSVYHLSERQLYVESLVSGIREKHTASTESLMLRRLQAARQNYETIFKHVITAIDLLFGLAKPQSGPESPKPSITNLEFME